MGVVARRPQRGIVISSTFSPLRAVLWTERQHFYQQRSTFSKAVKVFLFRGLLKKEVEGGLSPEHAECTTGMDERVVNGLVSSTTGLEPEN